MFAIDVRSRLDLDVLRRTFQDMLDRHAALRTTYTLAGGQFVQRVHSSVELDFRVADASGWQEELGARLVQEAARPYDLERDSTMRLRVYSRSPEDHVLLVRVHHICFDYWSYEIFVRELAGSYVALRSGVPAPQRPAQRQYTDYVFWQREMLAGPRGEQLWNYWQRELAGELPILNLPADRPRPALQTFTGAAFSFDLDPNQVKLLQSLATQQKVTLYVLMLAAFQVLLHCYTHEEDIIVGTPMACRESTDFNDAIVYFANLIRLRAN